MIAYPGMPIWDLRVERSIDPTGLAQIEAAGLPVPSLEDGYPNEYVAHVCAPPDRPGLARTRAAAQAMGDGGMRCRGHMLRFYRVQTGEEI